MLRAGKHRLYANGHPEMDDDLFVFPTLTAALEQTSDAKDFNKMYRQVIMQVHREAAERRVQSAFKATPPSQQETRLNRMVLAGGIVSAVGTIALLMTPALLATELAPQQKTEVASPAMLNEIAADGFIPLSDPKIHNDARITFTTQIGSCPTQTVAALYTPAQVFSGVKTPAEISNYIVVQPYTAKEPVANAIELDRVISQETCTYTDAK